MLQGIEKDLKEQVRRTFELRQEIHLFASETVGKAADEIAELAVVFQMTSAAPGMEEKLDEAYQQLIKDALPRYRSEVRRELDARVRTV